MSGNEHDPLNFREVDSQGNTTGYGRVAPPGGFAQKGYGQAGSGQSGFGQPGAAPEQRGLPEQQGAAAYAEADYGQRSRLAVNPFVAALWVIVAVLLVSPFGVFTLAQEALNAGTEPQIMPVSYMWITFAPQILFAGIAGLLGLLFWHAAQWQRNRAKQPPPS
ncbi:hypothetical protein ACFUTU_10320 [Arthrobacter sp. NPDC057388]|uniref:hypothetical protein n=1 Tax=Arthrobacter sp. NPDC057388 TaxID=3346116 RepID=UPI0036444453